VTKGRTKGQRAPSVTELSNLVTRLDAALRSIARIVGDTQTSETERLENIRRELDTLGLPR
jgi:hypothetical protein